MTKPPPFRFSFGIHPPVRRVRPDDVLDVTLPDSDGLGPDLKRLPRAAFDWNRGQPFPDNPVYGPFHVEGADAGDAVEVHFLNVKPNRAIARTLIAHNHGFLPGHLVSGSRTRRVPTRMIHWKLGRTTARIANPFGSRAPAIPLAPFLGCVATASSQNVSSLDAFSHGGNMDVPDLVAGSILWLPVSVPGGLLYLGDMHAAQGHGEIVGGGLEVSGRVRVRIGLRRHVRLRWPRYQTQAGCGCIVVQRTMEAGVKLSLAEMIQWFAEAGQNRFDAYLLASQACEFRFGGINSRGCTVVCFVPNGRHRRSAQRSSDRFSIPRETA
jgi:acetamidase/formamidase